MIRLTKLHRLKRQRLSGVLGLALDGGRLDGVALRRTNGSLHVQETFSVSLSLDPLTNDPELVGREIRNHLDAVGIRERQCVVGLPLKWALATHVEVPELPEADVASFLQIEAERGFPCDVQTLHVASSRVHSPAGKQQALLVGIPRNHLAVLERALRAAKLKPVSFSLGITALQPAGTETSNGVMALAIGESNIGLQVTTGGGVAALRALEGALEAEGSQRLLHADVIAREARITLGQLPGELRQTVRRIRVFGPRDLAQQLVDELELRLDATELKVEAVGRYAASDFGLQLPPDTTVSPAFSLAAGQLAAHQPVFEFLLPRVTPLRQMAARYASGKLRTAISAAAAMLLLGGGLFFYQQAQLWQLEAQWAKLQPTIKELQDVQDQIRHYRPWFDESVRGLTIMRCLTEAFPQDGSVTAKTVEIKDLNTVTCNGTARDRQTLLKTIENLRKVRQFREVTLGPTRGQSPAVQFTFSVQWNEGGQNAD
jgi:Tfp pilus assembly protein PilN